MRITAIYEQSVNLQGSMANAVVDFSTHTVSLVVLVSDQLRNGKPVCGVAFNSIGRFAQGGILRDRLMPRLLSAKPDAILNSDETGFSPQAIAEIAMRNEKPGGHGDRASAVAALELATWDLNAKLADEPAYVHIAATLGSTPLDQGAPVYAAGGYYYPDDKLSRLKDELFSYRDRGYDAFKIKIGGTSLPQDLQRIEAAIDVAGQAQNVAVDANGRFDLTTAQAYGTALGPYDLRWYEEPGDPLDYALMADLVQGYPGPIATGENLFSTQDCKNLTQFAGLRPQQDILQMDPGLAYGLTEYLDMLNIAALAGFERSQCIPHGGHLINLHIVTALGLGGCEAYPGVFQPFGGYSPGCKLTNGRIQPSDAPGFGLEQKPELAPLIANMLEH
jgi:L-alanine-DL-glutamate epimerase-like enolase superfamily enzyme